MLALSEAIVLRAPQFRGTEIDAARRAGATWPEVASAIGAPEAQARDGYRAWADGQHVLWRNSPPGSIPIGLDDDEYAAALARLESDGEEVSDDE